MFAWLSSNIGTVVVFVVLILILGCITTKKALDRKKGKHSCSCGCENCPNSSVCHEDT